MKLGRFVCNRRIEKNMSITKLAYEIKRTYMTVRRIEDSESLPTMETMSRIASTLDIPIDEISSFSLTDRVKKYRETYQDYFDRYKNGEYDLDFHCPVPKLVPIRTGTSCYDYHPLIGSLLTTLREAAKLTVRQVSVATKHRLKTIHSIEEGYETLSLKMIFCFAELYNCSPESIFIPFLEEKMKNYIRLYHVAFKHFKDGTKPERKKKEIIKRENSDNGVALLFSQMREDNDLSDFEMSKLIGCHCSEVDRILRGGLPSYRVIYDFAQAFSISPDVVFEIAFKDRIGHFEEGHKKIMYNYLLRKNDRQTIFKLKFSNERLKTKLPFKKVSNFLLTNIKRHSIMVKSLIEKIGCDRSNFYDAKRGQKSLTPLMIEGLAIIFGKDKYELFDMVLKEKIEVYSNDYMRQWKLYKEKINETEDFENHKKNQLQVA